MGLAAPEAPAVWRLSADHQTTLRAMGERGDVIRTLNRVARGSRSAAEMAPDGERSTEVITGRLVDRGLYDEVGGQAFVIIDATDGRLHHIRLPDLERSGDTPVGGIVEFRPGGPDKAASTIVHRSDLDLAAQVTAPGATWLDRQLVARDAPPLAHTGFGGEVRAAMAQRGERLVSVWRARDLN